MGVVEDFQGAPAWQRMTIVILGLLLFFGGLKNYVIKDKPREIRKLHRQIRTISRDLVNKKAAADDLEFVQEEFAHVQTQISRVLPSMKTTMVRLGDLVAEGKAQDMTFSLMEPGTLIDEVAYWHVPVRLQCDGSLPALLAFVRRVETSAFRGNINYFSIHLNDADPQHRYRLQLTATAMASKDSGEDSVSMNVPVMPIVSAKSTEKIHPAHKKPPKKVAPLHLDGFWQGASDGAFISGKYVHLGGKINGYSVVSISPESGRVILKNKNKRVVLRQE
jgi:Tfp pilus assembly protein PilO